MNGDCIIQLAEPQIDKYERQALATHNAVAWQDRLTDNWLILEEVNPLPKASSVSSLPDWHRQWLSARHSSRCCFWSLCYQTASCLCARKAFVSLRSLVCLQSRLHRAWSIFISKLISFSSILSEVIGLMCARPQMQRSLSILFWVIKYDSWPEDAARS